METPHPRIVLNDILQSRVSGADEGQVLLWLAHAIGVHQVASQILCRNDLFEFIGFGFVRFAHFIAEADEVVLKLRVISIIANCLDAEIKNKTT